MPSLLSTGQQQLMRRFSRRRRHKSPDFFYRRGLCYELLEDRRLLNGITLITHGFQLVGGFPVWASRMAEEVTTRIARDDFGRSQEVAQFRMTITDSLHPAVTGWAFDGNFVGSGAPEAFDLKNSLGSEAVICLDWSTLTGVSTVTVAELTANYLLGSVLGNLGQQLVGAPIHLIGHSRGGSLVGELAADLGERGLWVDQVTTLDPHPLSVDADALMTAWNNVTFWDNYWEDSYAISGERIPGTCNNTICSVPPPNNPLSFPGPNGYGIFSGGSHSDTHLWYQGTIDVTSTTISDGSASFNALTDGWYGGTNPGRTTSGFYYSASGGGLTSRPLDGIPRSVGGTDDSRVPLPDQSQAVWPNVVNLTMDESNGHVNAGSPIHVNYWSQDNDSSTTSTFFLDDDQNPYNGNEVRTSDFQQQAGGPRKNSQLVSTTSTSIITGVPYYLLAKITDGNRSRYAYAPGTVTVDPTSQLTAGILAVTPDPRNTPVGLVTVTFSEPVQGVDITDFRLTRNGQAVILSGANVTPLSSTQYTVDLSGVTGAAGSYVLTLKAADSNIQNAAGNPLAADSQEAFAVHPRHNVNQACDVDDNGKVTPLDVLTVIIYINAYDSGPVTSLADGQPPFLDVTGDDFVTPADVLVVINFINQASQATGGEGEAALPATVDPSPVFAGAPFDQTVSFAVQGPIVGACAVEGRQPQEDKRSSTAVDQPDDQCSGMLREDRRPAEETGVPDLGEDTVWKLLNSCVARSCNVYR